MIENAHIESKEHNAQTIQEENSASEIETNNKEEYTPTFSYNEFVESELEETEETNTQKNFLIRTQMKKEILKFLHF